MPKAYIQFRKDLADKAAIETFAAANPKHFTIGTIIVAANGDACIVTTAAGVTKAFTVAEPTP